MSDLPIIRLSHKDWSLLSWKSKDLHGIYITEQVTNYYVNGKQHREDGPAQEWLEGTKYWMVNDRWHRLDGPAMESNTCFMLQAWYVNGRPHRLDGPAKIYKSGFVEYWISNGGGYSKEFSSKEEYEKEAYLINNGLKDYK